MFYPQGETKKFDKVTLECSLKPFHKVDDKYITDTVTKLWENWRTLIGRAKTVAVLLWVGDGSEFFLWSGDLNDEVPCGHSIGFCNFKTPGAFPKDNRHYRVNAAVPYIDNPPKVTFAHLKKIISELRRVGKEILGLEKILIGATIDPGPEFVENDWKFVNHPEILTKDGPERFPNMMHFLTHQSCFHADKIKYAAFPDGLPEGLPLGTFLGKQFDDACNNLGYDYIWFSNGFAYSHLPWGFRGELFEGDRFITERADRERELANKFWTDFRDVCDAPIEVRGTNFTIGMDISSDGCSHVDINSIGKLEVPPVNPPWGARALGMEMISYLSRLAKTPTARLPFRFYLNDPWFNSTPWYDYYGRETFDLYTPMSAARISDDGSVDSPNELCVLTIDDEHGQLLTDQATEATPNMIRALDEAADAAGPVTWVYPYDEYDDILKNDKDNLGKPFFIDWFMVQAANAGLPVATVISSDKFCKLADAGKLPESVYVVPLLGRGDAYEAAAVGFVRSGGKAIFVGSAAGSSEFCEVAGLEIDAPIAGDLGVDVKLNEDVFEAPVKPPTSMDAFGASIGHSEDVEMDVPDPESRPLIHRELISDGGITEVAKDQSCVRVSVSKDGAQRSYAIVTDCGSGKLAWIRGTVSFDPFKDMLEGTPDQPWNCRRPDDWPRRLLGELGMDIVQHRRDEGIKPAYIFIKRNKGAWVFVGHKPNTTALAWFRTEDGAPVFPESETPIVNGYSGERFAKSINSEVRCFVKMPDGYVQVKEMPPLVHGRRQLSLSNLENAEVTIYPDPIALTDGSLKVTKVITSDDLLPYEVDEAKGCIKLNNQTGTLFIAW